MKYELKKNRLTMTPETVEDGFVLGKIMDKLGGDLTRKIGKDIVEDMQISVKINDVISKLVWS